MNNALIMADTADKLAFAEFIRASGNEENKRFYDALVDPQNANMDIKCVAISCGMDLVALSHMFKRSALAEAMVKVTSTISSRVNDVVTSALDRAIDPEASDRDRRLALEVCGVIDSPGKGKINLNVNQQQNVPQDHRYESAAMVGTRVLETEVVDTEDPNKPPSHKKKNTKLEEDI